MTPKEKYDERKRLKAERLLKQEQDWEKARQSYEYDDAEQEEFKAMARNLVNSLGRIADVAELWAEQQQ